MTANYANRAEVLLDTCLAVKAGERVLIVADREHERIGKALIGLAERRGSTPLLTIVPEPRLYSKDPSPALVAAMESSDVVLLCLEPEFSCQIWHTEGRQRASERGSRIGLVFPPPNWEVTGDQLVATARLTQRIASILDKGSEVRVTTPAGTDLVMDIRVRPGFACSSLLHERGATATVPDWGDAEISPREGSTRGIAVIDGSMPFIGLIRDPISVVVEAGVATQIAGGREAQRLREIFADADSNAATVAEFGIGTVGRGKLTGHKDDFLLGTCHLAFGHNISLGGVIDSNVHLDGVMRSPTIVVDGKELMHEGQIDPGLLDGPVEVHKTKEANLSGH